ncbi:MAG TPA: CHAP domain-containing protein [Candidatus Saccharimonadales bacterium]|nr:CHAP domain-containing protein [Candidatus Saccharimonadales bacterium]
MQQKIKRKLKISFRSLTFLVVVAAVVFTLTGFAQVSADRFDEQIRKLQQENAGRQDALSDLRGVAADYQQAIAVLRQQLAQVQAEINANIAKQAELQKKIEETVVELERQRAILGADIKAMYVDGDISTIEMLATSKNLSDFVDKEAYRNAVQKKIQETLKKITKLQAELQAQKDEVDQLLLQQRAQQQQLDANKAEQSRLLSMNQQQQAEFNTQIKGANSQIAELRRQQAEENCRIFGCSGGVLGGGGYPWGYAKCLHTGQVEGSCYNYDWAVNGSAYNSNTGGWGYRNCTDWVAFRSGGRVPSASLIHFYGGGGHAKYWDDAGRGMKKQVDSSPSAGDTAVSNTGGYGHVMYVEEVHGDGSITVSDYNRAGTGKYDTSTFEKVGDGEFKSPTGRTYSLTFVTW